MFSVPVLCLCDSAVDTLHRIQRKCGRLLLGYSSRCPTPCVLAELGWSLWQTVADADRIRLCGRLAESKCVFTRWVLDASSVEGNSWVGRVGALCSPWCEGGMPAGRANWDRVAREFWEQASAGDAEYLWVLCSQHDRLANYQQARWCCEGVWGINSFLHKRKFRVGMSIVASRLLVGGQGLRAGDCKEDVGVTVNNCCVYCLEEGHTVLESLVHVVFLCPSYDRVRQRIVELGVLERGLSVFSFHRNVWRFKELMAIGFFLNDLWSTRLALAGGRPRKARQHLQLRAEASW